MLDLGPGVGALVLQTGADLHGAEIEISPTGRDDERSHKQVHERPVAGRPLYGAVFAQLPAGDYTLWLDATRKAPDSAREKPSRIGSPPPRRRLSGYGSGTANVPS